MLFPLHPEGASVLPDALLQRVSQFRYLGIEIHRDVAQFLPLNLTPVMTLLSQRCAAWKTLPLTPVGRVNLVKMSVLPRFLYVFRQTLVHIPQSFFKKLDKLIISFVWNGGVPRIAKSTLQLPLSLGGLALPCFLKYYWAAVLVTLRWWLSEEPVNPSSTLEVALLRSYAELRNLIHCGPKYHPLDESYT